ncbi:MAG: hypothetical protein K9M51_03240 [Candidatus Gracilibacteria bacterium]|nr:hypothetical protein [Candidatus Gracilibacteria bacterium]
MKFKNPFHKTTWTIGYVILIVWLVFSILFIARAAWNYSMNGLYQMGIRRGQDTAVTQIIALGQRCQPIQLFAGQGANRAEVVLVNPACTQEQINQAAQQFQPPVETPEEEVPPTEVVPVEEAE